MKQDSSTGTGTVGSRWRAAVRAVMMVATIATASTAIVAVPSVVPGGGDAAQAVNLAEFDAGNIISDEVFYDSGSMTEGEIAAFMHTRLGSCESGATCLLNVSTASGARAADRFCAGYTAAVENAAQIVANVARSCGINPRVLMVMLQKEQSLLTDRSLTQRQLNAAMGYACPDTAPCDTLYYGLQNQLYSAARQFKIYQALPGSFNHRAGQVNAVRFHPNVSCGSSQVYIHNAATASLYNYTPYQPNGAALANPYGTGDTCSSYGNRNFFAFYVDWFGPTTYDVPGALGAYWRTAGASGSEIGTPVTRAFYSTANGGGHAQSFTRGHLYLADGGAVVPLRSSSGITVEYQRQGSQNGALGWPRSPESCQADRCQVDFQNGVVTWSASGGVRAVVAPFVNTYRGLQGMYGALGAAIGPAVDFTAAGGGKAQNFQTGYLYSSAAGVHHLRTGSAIYAAYSASGSQYGTWGWPASSELCDANGCMARFQNTVVGWTAGGGVQAIAPALWDAWRAAPSSVGYPTAAAATVSSGLRQQLSGGVAYARDGVAVVLRSASGITARYESAGGAGGALGWPTEPESCTATVCGLPLTNGMITWSSTAGVHVVSGAVAGVYAAEGGPFGAMGPATSAELAYPAATGGSAQNFARGYIYSSSNGIAALRTGSAIFQAYAASGSQNGPFGWPSSSESCNTGGCAIAFQRGVITWSPGVGVREVPEPFAAAYQAAGAQTGQLGYPRSSAVAYPVSGGGQAQDFAGGYLYASSAGTYPLLRGSGMLAEYQRQGSQYGALGWPTAAIVCGSTTCFMDFQRGRLTTSR